MRPVYLVILTACILFYLLRPKPEPVPKWPDQTRIPQTGDIVVVPYLDTGHTYLVIRSPRYQQTLLWDLTVTGPSYTYKSLEVTLRRCRVAHILHLTSPLSRPDLTRRIMCCMRGLTRGISYDSTILLDHVVGLLEETFAVPLPHVTSETHRYCSMFIFVVLVACDILHTDIYTTYKSSIFYPNYLLRRDSTLNKFMKPGWSYSRPYRVMHS